MDWLRQTGEPLFPKVLWERPLQKRRAGRLLLIGGQPQAFSQLEAVYRLAEAAGIGECQLVMPDSLRRTIGEQSAIVWAPATAGGSLGKASLSTILELMRDCDALAIGGDLTFNSETITLVESLLLQVTKPVILFNQALPALSFQPSLLTAENRLIVSDLPNLFKLAGKLGRALQISSQSQLLRQLDLIKQLGQNSQADYLIFEPELIVTSGQQQSVTQPAPVNPYLAAASVAIGSAFWLQQHQQPFAALTTAAYVIKQALADSPTTLEQVAKAVRLAVSAD